MPAKVARKCELRFRGRPEPHTIHIIDNDDYEYEDSLGKREQRAERDRTLRDSSILLHTTTRWDVMFAKTPVEKSRSST
jgi:hypothetical protein